MQNLNELLKRRILFVTGKGGIGKTTVAVHLACAAAAQGKRVCIVESRVDDQVAPLFGHPPIGHNITKMRGHISAINLDPRANFRDFVVKHLGFETLFDKVFNTKIIRSFIRMLPGVAELTLLGRLYHLVALADEPFDLVVFDGYSSGHFLNLLSTPDAVLKSGLVGPVLNETKRLMDYLNVAGNSGIVLVTTPELLVMSECFDFLPRLINTRLSQVLAVVVNRYMDDVELSSDLASLAQNQSYNQIREAATYCERRYEGSRGQALKLRDLIKNFELGSIAVLTNPDFGVIEEPISDVVESKFFNAMEYFQ